MRSQETAIGNLIADATKDAVGADKEYAAGSDITRRDVLTELPFGNVTVLTEVTGQQVWDVLENGFSKYEDGAGRFPQVSGLKVLADVKKPASSRLVSVMAGTTALKGGKVTVDARGGKVIANDVLVLVKKLGVVDAKMDGRIVIQ